MTDNQTGEPGAQLRRMSLVSLALTALGIPAALPLGISASAGVAAGGLLGLGLLHSHRVLAASLHRAANTGGRKPLLAWLYPLRWPVIAAVLYGLLATKVVSPVGLCVGITILPVAITVVAVLTARANRGRSV